jgi:hypothetical protein
VSKEKAAQKLIVSVQPSFLKLISFCYIMIPLILPGAFKLPGIVIPVIRNFILS